MKTLIEIKNEVAKEWFLARTFPFKSSQWDGLPVYKKLDLWPEVCRRAQLECARETLKEAADNAIPLYEDGPCTNENIDKSTITDDSNIKLVE